MSARTRPAGAAPPRASGDRWLFGYADIVTLLFACFASLYAAQVHSAGARVQPSDIVLLAPPPVDPVEPEPPLAALERALSEAIGRQGDAFPALDLRTTGRGLVISLPEAGSFPAGQADPTPAAEALMSLLAAYLGAEPYLLAVEGHTDDVPIATATYRSNWELSSARATRVVEVLIGLGLDPARLSAAGFAEYRPLLPNASPEARARNRRVDIVVIDPAVEPADHGLPLLEAPDARGTDGIPVRVP